MCEELITYIIVTSIILLIVGLVISAYIWFKIALMKEYIRRLELKAK